LKGNGVKSSIAETRNFSTMKRIQHFEQSDLLRKRAHQVIPGGAHTYSKGDDQFPQLSPGFIARGKGCYVYDVDGNKFIDYGMGLRSVILGHCHPVVTKAVKRELSRGNNFTRPSPLEVEVAEALIAAIPCAEMVKFAKNGSTITTGAVKLARAYTGRDLVARCAQHPFFSYDDWFIGSTVCNAGVPKAIAEQTLLFDFNDPSSLESLFKKRPGEIAAVILEPATTEEPHDDFLQRAKDICAQNGAVFVLDEMITGFRWHARGAQTYYDVVPDLATFGKALGNGFSLAALVGKREIMELGGIDHASERVFLLSTTHGAESISLAAALATLQIIREEDVVGHLWRIGASLVEGLNGLSKEFGLRDYFYAEGVPCSPAIVCKDQKGQPSAALRTLFLQEMIARGILIPYVSLSQSHTEAEISITLDAVRDFLPCYQAALDGELKRLLVGAPVKPVFRKYN
jgi:glutamate-1-semialdehyde 2,1-aminomutase